VRAGGDPGATTNARWEAAAKIWRRSLSLRRIVPEPELTSMIRVVRLICWPGRSIGLYR